MTKQRRKFKRIGTVELPEAEDKRITKMIEEAEKELDETRVSFRWGKEQLDLVKRAAKQMGVPYQTYLKQVVYRQCLIDLKSAADFTGKKRA